MRIVNWTLIVSSLVLTLCLATRVQAQTAVQPQLPPIDSPRIAQRLVDALKPAKGERAILTYDPTYYPELAQEIMSLFERINGQGTTVLVATHDRHLIQSTRKRVLGLEHGRMGFDQPAPASMVVV